MYKKAPLEPKPAGLWKEMCIRDRVAAGAALYARNQITEDGDDNAAVDGSGAVIAAADEAAHSPVSYTHLDVCKRQYCC